MKKLKFVKQVFLVLCFLLVFSSCKESAELKTITTKNSISITLPENWKNLDDETEDNILVYLEKNENENDDFNSNINLIKINHQGENLDFNQFIPINKNYFSINKIEILEEKSVEVNGQEAYLITSNANNEGVPLKVIQILQLYNEVGYTTTFICEDKKFNTLKDEAIEIMKSFKFDVNKI